MSERKRNRLRSLIHTGHDKVIEVANATNSRGDTELRSQAPVKESEAKAPDSVDRAEGQERPSLAYETRETRSQYLNPEEYRDRLQNAYNYIAAQYYVESEWHSNVDDRDLLDAMQIMESRGALYSF